MNAHIPQSYEATAELQEIAAVPMQIIRPRDGTPLIAVVQDALAGAYLATQPGNLFTRREFMNLMMKNSKFQELPKPREGQRYTGQQIIGSLFAPINVNMKNSSYEKDSRDLNIVKVVEGEFLQGVLDKGIFNKSGKGIIHTTYNDYGPADTVALLDGLQNVVEAYLILKGFSVGISDLIADEDTKQQMEETIAQKKKEVDEMLLQLHMDLFTNNSGKSNQEEVEARAFGILNKAMEGSGDIGLKGLSNHNRLMAMVRSGSKGDAVNVSQMIACVGQTALEGKRIPYGFTDRTLPHYKMYDDGAEARGFVEGSFVRGLTPQEMFFHAMSGREGLIDTAVKTAETGYTQRQLIKAMEELTTQHDGTVRDATGAILQFYYGEDGINSTKIEEIDIPLHKLKVEEIRATFGLQGVDLTGILEDGVDRGDDKELLEEYVNAVLKDRKMLVEGVYQSAHTRKLFVTLNIERILTNIKIKFNLQPTGRTSLTPAYILESIQKLIERTQPFNKVWIAALRYHLAPHTILANRFTQDAWNTLIEAIVVKNWKAWAVPGELVGIVAAQSIGEPATQMTLNSVDWDTEIVIAKNGKIITPQIGEFIDDYYMNCSDDTKVQHLENGRIYIELNDGNDWKAVSCDEDGNMKWTKLEAITRHPVVNEDGTNTILQVEMESGRTMKATKGKSFLTFVNGKIVATNGSDLKVGDELPIANHLAIDGIGYIKELSLREFLPPSEYLYGTEVKTALETMRAYDERGERHWFQQNQGKIFTVPYGRSDSFREAFANGHNSNDIRPGCVYNKHMKLDVSQIPESIPLTTEFGFFAGAYLAEGMSNKNQICITNNDAIYLAKVKELMDTWKVGVHTVCEEREAKTTGIKGTTTSMIIHSTILAKVMSNQFGRVSYMKTLPDWVLQAPDDFLKGLVDGYICGDGCVSKQGGYVTATSVSEKLLVKLGAVFARFGIFTTMSNRMPELKNFKSVSRHYTMVIPIKYSNIFHETFELTLERKQHILDALFLTRKDEVIQCKWKQTRDMVWDKIKNISEVVPMKDGWVYDLTVFETRNFICATMMAGADTFHQAGVASKSAMTRGVPRLKELLKVTHNPKATSLAITLIPAFRNDKDRVREVTQDLELTLLRDIVLKAGIYYDPKDSETVIEEDKELITFFEAFEMRQHADDNPPTAAVGDDKDVKSRWLIRLEFDREKMFNKNITMDDVNFVVTDTLGFTDQRIRTVYSDYNSQNLIMRIRVQPSDSLYGDDLASIKKFQNKLLNNTVIRGVTGIKSVNWRKDKSQLEDINGVYTPVEQYILDTDGANFMAVMNHPAVDGNKLYSTNVHDIYEQLGIEATRYVLYSEISSLFGEADINYRHLGLLMDVMTRNGRLMSVDRYGINKNDSGPLAKACFEETEKILLKAALFGEMDPVTGVSANIMTGQTIRAGTAFSQVLLDEAALPRLMEGLTALPEDEEEEDEVPDQSAINAELYSEENDMCAQTQLQMNMTLPVATADIEEDDIEIIVS